MPVKRSPGSKFVTVRRKILCLECLARLMPFLSGVACLIVGIIGRVIDRKPLYPPRYMGDMVSMKIIREELRVTTINHNE